MRANVRKCPASQTHHHRCGLVDSVPPEPVFEPADRGETDSRVHLGRSPGVKSGAVDLLPFRSLRFVKRWPRDSQLGVSSEFSQQRLDEFGPKRNIRVEPQDIVVALPHLAGEKLHDYRFPALGPWSVVAQMMNLNPRIGRSRFIQYLRGGIGRAVVNDYPTLGQDTLLEHRVKQPREEFLLVAGRCYGYVFVHSRYSYTTAPRTRVVHSG